MKVKNKEKENIVEIKVKKGEGIIVMREKVIIGLIKGWKRKNKNKKGKGEEESKELVKKLKSEKEKEEKEKKKGENSDVLKKLEKEEM